MMKERVLAWYNKSKTVPVLKKSPWKERLPEHVLFYRDGVSESQHKMVRGSECPHIREGCQEAFKVLQQQKAIPSALRVRNGTQN